MHDAPTFQISEPDYVVYVTMTDGTTVPNKTTVAPMFKPEFVGNEDGLMRNRVLKLVNQDKEGICMSLIEKITVMKTVKGTKMALE